MQKSTKNRCIDAENVVSYQEIGNLLPQGDFGKEVFYVECWYPRRAEPARDE